MQCTCEQLVDGVHRLIVAAHAAAALLAQAIKLVDEQDAGRLRIPEANVSLEAKVAFGNITVQVWRCSGHVVAMLDTTLKERQMCHSTKGTTAGAGGASSASDARRTALRALRKVSRTRAAPTPTKISMNSEPLAEKKGTPLSPAMAFASSVLPHPDV